MATGLCDTLQLLAVAGKDGRAFLRRVVKGCNGEDWRVRASATSDWRLVFRRVVKGAVGEPDVDVEVHTDVEICFPGDGCFGKRQSFFDSQPVTVVRPQSVFLSGSDVSALAKLLLDGCSLSITASAGSTRSSEHGLSFYTLGVGLPDAPHSVLAIGGETVAKDGRTLVAGAVDLY